MIKVPDWGNPVEPSSVSNAGISVDRPGMVSAAYGAKALKYQAFASIADTMADDFEREYQKRQEAERRMRVASATADLSRASFELKNQFKDYQDFDQIRPGSKKMYDELAFAKLDQIQDPEEKAAVYDAANRIGLGLEVDAESYSFGRKKDVALAKSEADIRHYGQEFVSASNATSRKMVEDKLANYLDGLVQAGMIDAADAQLRFTKERHDWTSAAINNAINSKNPLYAQQLLEENRSSLAVDDAARMESAIVSANESQKAIQARVYLNQADDVILMAKDGMRDDAYAAEAERLLIESGQEAAADDFRRKYESAAFEGEAMQQMAQVPLGSLDEIIAKAPNYETQEKLRSVIPKIVEMRNDDPRGYVNKYFGAAAQTDAGAIAAQEQIGIPEYNRRVLSKAEAAQYKDQLMASKDPTAIVQGVQQIINSRPEAYQAYALNDLKRAGLPASYYTIALFPENEQVLLNAAGKAAANGEKSIEAALKNQDLKEADISEFRKNVSSISEFRKNVSSNMEEYTQTWIESGYPLVDMQEIHTALSNTALMLKIDGLDDDKAQAAVTKWVNDSYKFGSSNVSHPIRVPKTYGRSTVESRLTTALDRLTGIGNNPRTVAFYGMNIPAAVAAGDMYFANTRDDKGVTLYYAGKPVPLTKGDNTFALTIPFDVIQNAKPDEDLIQKAIQLNMEALKPMKPVAPVDNSPATAADVFTEEVVE